MKQRRSLRVMVQFRAARDAAGGSYELRRIIRRFTSKELDEHRLLAQHAGQPRELGALMVVV